MTMELGRREWFYLFLEGFPGVVYLREPDGRIRFANRSLRDRFGEPVGRICCEILCGSEEPCGECRTAGGSGAAPREWERVLSDGRFYRMHSYPFDDAGAPLTLVLGLDVTVLRKTEKDLMAHAHRQAAVALLGQRALADLDPLVLLDESAVTVASVLEVEFGSIMELLPDGDTLLLRAGAGFSSGTVGRSIAVEAVLSQAGYALVDDGSILVEDYGTETRTAGSSFLLDHGVASGVVVVISGKGRPFGILGAHSSQHRRFTRDDISFLQSVANVLAAALARKKAELALQESEERFRSLVEHALVGFFLVQDGRIVFQNPAQEKLFGPLPEALPLEDLSARAHPEDRERFLCLCDETGIAGSAKVEMDLRFVSGGRSEDPEALRWVHGRATPVLFRGRKALLVNTVDVTRAKELEHLALVREKMASLGHVAAGIAHEIRNPLSGLNLYLSALEKLWNETEEIEPEQMEAARVVFELMKAASLKIEGVIRRVMDYSRTTPPRFGLIDVNHSVREAIHLSSLTLRRQRIAIGKSLDESLPHCFADARLLEQVLLNLLTNAAQALEGFQGEKVIEVASAREGDHVVVTVADSGPGVPEAIRERIFDPFFTTKKDGTGIGLSLSRKIVSDHGGFLEIGTSALGGAEFRVGIPVGNGPT
jgi:PAS domain S-box-containing protein